MYSTLGFASGEIHVIWDISYFASSRRHLRTTKKKRTFSPCSKLSLPRWQETFTTDSRLTFSETEAEKNRLAQKKQLNFTCLSITFIFDKWKKITLLVIGFKKEIKTFTFLLITARFKNKIIGEIVENTVFKYRWAGFKIKIFVVLNNSECSLSVALQLLFSRLNAVNKLQFDCFFLQKMLFWCWAYPWYTTWHLGLLDGLVGRLHHISTEILGWCLSGFFWT